MLKSFKLPSQKKSKRSKSVIYDYISYPFSNVPVLKPKDIDDLPSPLILMKMDTNDEDFSLNSDNEAQVNSEETLIIKIEPSQPTKKKRSILNALCKRKNSKI